MTDRCWQETTGQHLSMQHQGLGTGDLEGDPEWEKRGGERHRTAGETEPIYIPSQNEMNREKERRGRNGG